MDVSHHSASSDSTDDDFVIQCMAYVMIIAGLASLVKQLLGKAAQYGRYAANNTMNPYDLKNLGLLWRPTIPAKLAWFLQELPAFSIPVLMVFFSEAKRLNNLPNVICLIMVIVHYFNR